MNSKSNKAPNPSRFPQGECPTISPGRDGGGAILFGKEILIKAKKLFDEIDELDQDSKVALINELRIDLHRHSPMKNQPVDCVLWIKSDEVQANDYNPNIVAPPEMKLLEHSIQEDGYTMPVVTWDVGDHFEVIDGFHRNRVCKESKIVKKKVMGYLPISIVNIDRTDRGDRIASTIRHNRARGKHTVVGMSDIVLELKARNWTNERIAKNLGMQEDEILRLCQITGLASLFSDQEFSKSWDIEDSAPDFEPLSDDIEEDEEEKIRTVNTNDPQRIFHTYDKWECYKAGFYATTKEGITREQGENMYAEFLRNSKKFGNALEHVISEWKNSCEHYLTNSAMNRIAWLGQAAMCYAMGIPSVYRSGFHALSEQEQLRANKIAHTYLNKWLVKHGRSKVSMAEAISDNQMDLY